MKVFSKYVIAALVCVTIVSSCGSDKNGNGPSTEYDRQLMLDNYADNLIKPGYTAFRNKTEAMESAVNAFVAAPSAATLSTVRAAYQNAYLAWQDVSVFEFGPADVQMLRTNLNIYPTASQKIENNIAAGTYNLQAAGNIDAKGFPAIDYLLYSAASDAAVVDQYVSAANAANRKKYLQDITVLIRQHVVAVHTSWTSENYAATFKTLKGTAAGSAVGYLVNQLNLDIDLTKRAKVGIPSGRFTAGTPLPEKVEAYYSRTSLELIKRAIQAEKAVFVGRAADGTDGPGLDDYLDHVKAPHGGGKLSDAIKAQFDAALAAANAINGTLVDAVSERSPAVLKLYDELQKLIVLTKTDMPSALGVSITYTDNDGD
jgi:uncharacterized protein